MRFEEHRAVDMTSGLRLVAVVLHDVREVLIKGLPGHLELFLLFLFFIFLAPEAYKEKPLYLPRKSITLFTGTK